VPEWITGHVIADLARSLIGLAVTVGCGYAVGFRPNAGAAGWAAGVAVILLVTLAEFVGVVLIAALAAALFKRTART
jgi:ABC-2 type transport system permease protein